MCSWASNTACRAMPSALARYMATSASRIRSSGWVSRSASAMPIEVDTVSSRPATVIGSPSACWMRAATAVASRASAMSSSRTVNSSPPSRATVSPGRSALPIRAATACSSSSPAWWPSESLTSLKRSRSRKSTAERPRGPGAAGAAQRPAEAVEEERAVGEPGERVVERVVAEPLERAPLVDGVAQRALQGVGGEVLARQVVDGAELLRLRRAAPRRSRRRAGSPPSAGPRRGGAGCRPPRPAAR